MKVQEKLSVPFMLAAVMMGSMLLRLGLILVLPRIVWQDEVEYLLLGRNLLSGQGFTNLDGSPHLVFPPGYPFIVGTVALLVRNLEWASNLVYVLCGGLMLFPVFVIAQRVYGTLTAGLSALLVAVCPTLSISILYWGSMTEPLYIGLVYGGLAVLLVVLEDQRWGLLPAAGGLLGLAYLVRPEAIGYFGLSLLVILIWLMHRGREILRQACWALGGFIVVFALVGGPYVWYLHAHTGRWLLTGKGGLTWELGAAQTRQDWAAADEIAGRLWGKPESFQGSLVQTILADPRGFMRRVLRNEVELSKLLYEARIYVYGLLPLITLALFRRPWNRRRAGHEAFLMVALIPFSVFFVFHVQGRYFAPALPVLLMWTAQGARELGGWLYKTGIIWKGRTIAGPWPTALLRWGPAGALVLLLVSLLPLTARAAQEKAPLHYKSVGLWLRAHTPAGTKVMARQDAITFHADRVQIPLPRTDWSGVLKAARVYGAEYLVVDDFELRQIRPQLAFLSEAPPPELAFALSFEGGRGRRTRVYRFVGPP